MARELTEVEVVTIREIVKYSFKEYPNNETTTDAIIDQAVRSAYVRGYSKGRDSQQKNRYVVVEDAPFAVVDLNGNVKGYFPTRSIAESFLRMILQGYGKVVSDS